MRALSTLIIFLLFWTPPLSSEPALPMNSVSVMVLDRGSALRPIAIRYEENNQAVIRNLELIFLETDRETNKTNILLLKGAVQNRLPRDLVNAQVNISFLNKDGETIRSEQRDILPRRLEKDDNGGRFFVKTEYSQDIALIEITLDWKGKSQ